MIIWIMVAYRYLFVSNPDDLDEDMVFGIGVTGFFEFIGECALVAHLL